MVALVRTRLLAGRSLARRAALALAALAHAGRARCADRLRRELARQRRGARGRRRDGASHLRIDRAAGARAWWRRASTARGSPANVRSSALRMVTSSPPLRTAVEADNAHDARTAARALLATEHLTDLRVTVGDRSSSTSAARRSRR